MTGAPSGSAAIGKVTAAIIGLIAGLLGIAIGRATTFWSGRRSELAEAVVAMAMLGEGLEQLAPGGSEAEAALRDHWNDLRRPLVVLMNPRDYEFLSAAMVPQRNLADSTEELRSRLRALHRLLWEEHEAFILVPLLHYIQGETLSKRIHEIFEIPINQSPLPPPPTDHPAAPE
jgi:hypothetical protein